MQIKSMIGRTLFALASCLALSGANLDAKTMSGCSSCASKPLQVSKEHHDSSDSDSDCCCIGSAFGANSTDQSVVGIIIPAQDLNSSSHTGDYITYLAPLREGNKLSHHCPFKFVPYQPGADAASATGAYYKIKHDQGGRYLFQYGMTGQASYRLNLALTSLAPVGKVWMCIQIYNHKTKTKVQLGAVPLSLSGTLGDSSPNGDDDMLYKSVLSGYGQISHHLKPDDQVSLQIFVGANYNTQLPSDFSLLISNDNITFPPSPIPTSSSSSGSPIASGPTLTITKISD